MYITKETKKFTATFILTDKMKTHGSNAAEYLSFLLKIKSFTTCKKTADDRK